MELKYYGVRGSIPSPGPQTVKYGGNTSCVVVNTGEGLIVLDAGSGIRQLGLDLMKHQFGGGEGEIHLLSSHSHWDHIQGFPFFVPAYIRGNTINAYGETRLNVSLEKAINGQQEPPCFPEDARLVADMRFTSLREWEPIEIAGAKVTPSRLNHPNGVFAYRIERHGKVIVYATDTEHYSCVDWKLAKLAKEADLLIYDAQYTPEQYPAKVRWGHSTFEEGTKVAKAAGVKTLHLFHHDPTSTDAHIDQIVQRAKELFPNTEAAAEGLEVHM